MIKIAVIGLGYMGQGHVRVLSSLSEVDIVAVCDKDFQKTEKISKQYRVKPYRNFKKLLKEEELDAISICLPTSLHFIVASNAAKKGIALFIEKPICSNSKEAKKLIELARFKKTPIMVGHIERFNPVVNEIKQRIKLGELGRILQIHTQRFSPPPARAFDVSAVVDLATHDIDIIQYLLDQKPVRIYAETDNKAHRKEDLMAAILRFKNGVIGLVEVSWLHPTKIRRLTVLGENGMYVADYITQELFFYRQNENLFRKNNISPTTPITQADIVKIAFQAKEPLEIELESFIQELLSGAKMSVTAEDGLVALTLAEKMINSGTFHKVLK
ncbi:hypothetical protein A3D81_01070 [Candidatus Curtissbacteria bacterium RIFCSPHIGHO2_02_FULL_40_17]|uniref:Gfo/Idh/MocA-like oxidoreductase N-terminal domain-containing protein n=4 Tax=Candidatus Curtissiibacteriota TaxID=1752717 RepID=A0A1F5GHN9_9BACT|nr:MAG: hypothetical protein A2693_03255 [Candidatus Curtissbacteria bacterium RIFCSPHIGHO2_01_FULL_40_12]OGD91374.1 MAG: hypothetical protein A3D81_01070 [Candidatus Curtissbacteria bacterium RIFCSPHIGHO2_02_FULL_40_17]OGE04030.1 MAG: hypothetical protein A3F45_02755 [Candidatus Curtissbacteria bacterium RIFCSPHIGHO2_12_FULL_41_17]OGE08583.1 MAG: hypothetical protein A3I53_02320 [Candidatus Curtissbacteria bacterium RIFCSPLOWO2_02_FULL_40_13b]